MPSDDPTVFPDALGKARDAFHAALVSAEDQIRGYLVVHRARTDDRAQLASLELGQFAGGRLDSGRFAAMVTGAPTLAADAEAVIERCAAVLASLLARGESLHTCIVPPGGDIHAAVDAAFADAGRAFGAAQVFRAVRAGTYNASQHEALLVAHPFSRWTRAERANAPPLVVHVNGADLRAGELAEYVDGRMKMVLLIAGDCTLAPLARLMTPGAFVQQTDDVHAFAAFAEFDGAAVAAVVPAASALFINDPAEEDRGGTRLTVSRIPNAPSRTIGTWSVWQQGEELALLASLARSEQPRASEQGKTEADATSSEAVGAVVMVSATAPTAPAADDERTLAHFTGWILSQSGLGGVSGVS